MFLILCEVSRFWGVGNEPGGGGTECDARGRKLQVKLPFILSCLWGAFLCAPIWAHAENIIRGSSCYTYGDSESAKAARDTVRSMALREALESAGIFLSSETTTRNFSLRDDTVKISSSATLKNIQVVEHTEEGRKICETIEASLDPASLEEGIKKAAEPAEKERKVSHVRLMSEFPKMKEKYGLLGTEPVIWGQEEERKICKSLEAGFDPEKVWKITERGDKWKTSSIRVLSVVRESHSVIIKAECVKAYEQTPALPLDRHPENRLGVTFCKEGRMENLSVSVCGRKGQIRIFQFQMPEQAVFYRYWAGD